MNSSAQPAELLISLAIATDSGLPAVARTAGDSWPSIARLAIAWSVSSYLLSRIHRHAIETGAEARALLSDHHRTSFPRSALTADRGARLCRHLEEQGVPAVAFKGLAAIVHLYRGPGERIIKDVDLLVAEKDAERAVEVLQAAGLELEDGGDWSRYRDFVRDLPGMAGNQSVALYSAAHGDIDLHWRFGGNPVEELAPERILARSEVANWNGKPLRVVSPADGLVLTAHHSLRENFAPQAMLRDLIDARHWFAVLRARGQFEQALVHAERCGLGAPVRAFASLLGEETPGTGPTPNSEDLVSLFQIQAREGPVSRDVASLADPGAWRKIARGALRGWRGYRATMAAFEVKTRGGGVSLSRRALALAAQMTGMERARWRALRTVARLKADYQEREPSS